METALKNWIETVNIKQSKWKLRRAFNDMKDRAEIYRRAQHCRKQLMLQKVKDKFTNLLLSRKDRGNMAVARAF